MRIRSITGRPATRPGGGKVHRAARDAACLDHRRRGSDLLSVRHHDGKAWAGAMKGLAAAGDGEDDDDADPGDGDVAGQVVHPARADLCLALAPPHGQLGNLRCVDDTSLRAEYHLGEARELVRRQAI